MVDLSKPPNYKTIEKIAKVWNMQYRLSLFPYIVTIIFLPIFAGIILSLYKIHTYWIVSCVVIIILIEYYLINNFLKNHEKKN